MIIRKDKSSRIKQFLQDHAREQSCLKAWHIENLTEVNAQPKI